MNKMCFSKKVLFATLIVCGLLEVFIIAAWIAFDRTDAATLAGVIASPAVTILGFYEWKAKAENVCKIQKSEKIEG